MKNLNWFQQVMVCFALVIVLGGIAIRFQNNSGRTVASDTYMLTAGLLNKNAKDFCEAEAKNFVNMDEATMPEVTSDGNIHSTLTWKSDTGPFKTIVCKYTLDIGIEELTIDGKQVIPKA